MWHKDKDSIANTFLVATAVCLFCSFLVTTAAIVLKPMQDRNIELDRKSNILQVAGFSPEEIKLEGVEILFDKRVESQIINLDTGEVATEEDMSEVLRVMKLSSIDEALAKYDQIKASKTKNDDVCSNLKKNKIPDVAKITARENFANVFFLMDESGQVIEQYIFPIRGYGLWSTLKGFLAVKPDFQTIVGITYYEHSETPGLGGEVDNVQWKAKWGDKQIFGPDGEVKIQVVKGESGDNPFGVDGLSGATITSKGVSNMLKYWLGPNAYGPYIEQQKSRRSSTSAGSFNKPGDIDG